MEALASQPALCGGGTHLLCLLGWLRGGGKERRPSLAMRRQHTPPTRVAAVAGAKKRTTKGKHESHTNKARARNGWCGAK